MAGDTELDRLKAAQDLAYQRKQDAYQVQQQAWERLGTTRQAMNDAFEAKQQAYEAQNASWQSLQQLRDSYGPQIERLNADQQTAYENMRRAFDNASAAHARRDGASAASYAGDGHRYKADSQRHVADRRRLVSELHTARQRHENTKPTFQQARAAFAAAKQEFERARSEHTRAKDAFQAAKQRFDEAKTAFQTRLEKVRADHARRKNDRRAIAEKAGVPSQYLGDVWVSSNGNDGYNIYFGGVGRANGPGHGHYVVDRMGKLTYKRDPFNPHGAQNFTENQRSYEELVMRESQSGDFAFHCRFRGYDAFVETNINDAGIPKIDIYYGPNGPFGPGHHHAGAYRTNPLTIIFDKLRG